MAGDRTDNSDVLWLQRSPEVRIHSTETLTPWLGERRTVSVRSECTADILTRAEPSLKMTQQCSLPSEPISAYPEVLSSRFLLSQPLGFLSRGAESEGRLVLYPGRDENERVSIIAAF